MLFNSLVFLVFMGLVLGFYALPLPWLAKKVGLLLASYVFYGAWNPPFTLLLLLSTSTDWLVARRIHRSSSLRHRRLWLAVTLTVNLGLLGFFKYSGFLLANCAALWGCFGSPPDFGSFHVLLPVGISFYTFQSLSYSLDVYRGKLTPDYSFLDYALYVSFFPQLVAGPIVRAVDLLPQFSAARRATAPQFSWGANLLVLGLFEKVVLADGFLAPVAERVYGQPGVPTFAAAWGGTLAFAGQIFCDFAGYSTCAIGAAMMLGFTLPDNFRFPYAAIGFSDFWRRWHISLSSWLRDYFYITLGGNRQGPLRTMVNLLITMFLGGLWHGANWTFVAWGLLHGFYLVAERLLAGACGHWALWRGVPGRLLLGGLTFLGVCLAWVFFRAATFTQAFRMLAVMFGGGPPTGGLPLPPELLLSALAVVGGLLLVHGVMRDTTVEALAARTPWWLLALANAAMLLAIITMPGDARAFIYFQF